MVEPPTSLSACRKASSEAGSDGVLKSTSKATSLAPAASSLRSSSAWSLRGQGHHADLLDRGRVDPDHHDHRRWPYRDCQAERADR